MKSNTSQSWSGSQARELNRENPNWFVQDAKRRGKKLQPSEEDQQCAQICWKEGWPKSQSLQFDVLIFCFHFCIFPFFLFEAKICWGFTWKKKKWTKIVGFNKSWKSKCRDLDIFNHILNIFDNFFFHLNSNIGNW